MRLDKFIAGASAFSRSQVRTLLLRKRVLVNGDPPKGPDAKISENDTVSVDGKPLKYREHVYLMLNKPAGYLSATEDKTDPVVIELVPEEFRKRDLFPVGRLDKDTEGLLFLTDDGAFDHALTSPKKKILKTYFAVLDRPAEEKDVALFASGMKFQDFTAAPAELILTENPKEVLVRISEGKFHQVKRMCSQAGKEVVFLKRIRIGEVELDPALPIGKTRELTAEELSLLRGNDISGRSE